VLGVLGAFVLGFQVLTLHPFWLLHASHGNKKNGAARRRLNFRR
jgi:hypothetical protein